MGRGDLNEESAHLDANNVQERKSLMKNRNEIRAVDVLLDTQARHSGAIFEGTRGVPENLPFI